MMLERGSRLCGPSLEIRVLSLVPIALEKVDRILVNLFLVRMVLLGEIIALQLAELNPSPSTETNVALCEFDSAPRGGASARRDGLREGRGPV